MPPQVVASVFADAWGAVRSETEQHYPWMEPSDWCGEWRISDAEVEARRTAEERLMEAHRDCWTRGVCALEPADPNCPAILPF